MSAPSLEEEIQQKLRTNPSPIIPILPRSPQVNSPFLTRFPLEVRRQIYESALAPNPTFRDVDFRRPTVENPDNCSSSASLLRTCTRIYHEASTMLYSLNFVHISLDGSYSKTPWSYDAKGLRTLRKQYLFPPREDTVLSETGEACMPEVTYGGWRKYVSAEKWAVANLTFYIDPYWPTWSIKGGECLKWWTVDPVVRPAKIQLVIWVVAQLGSIPFHVSEIAQAVHHSKGLQKGTLELRTMKGREPRLDEYILRLLKLKINMVEGGVLEWDQRTPIVWDGEKEKEYEKVGMEPIDCEIDTWSLPYEEKGYVNEPKEMDKFWWIRINWVVT